MKFTPFFEVRIMTSLNNPHIIKLTLVIIIKIVPILYPCKDGV